MTVKDVTGKVIVPQTLPNAQRVISTAAWYNNFRYWCCCGVEIVADENESDSQQLSLYAHVFDWIDSRHSGSVSSFRPWAKYDDVQYGASKMSVPLPTDNYQIYSSGGSNKIFTDGDSGDPWDYYFYIGSVSSGSVSSKGAQTGWKPISAGAWSGAEGRSDGTVGSPVTASYTVERVTISYSRNGGNGSDFTSYRVKGWAGSNFSIEISNQGDMSRQNYAFTKWNTAADGSGVDYLPGTIYSGDSDLILYAQWTPTDKTLSYNANLPVGTTGTVTVPGSTTASATASIAISSVEPDGSNLIPPWTFVKWNTQANGNGTDYVYGDSYSGTSSQVLYAQWTSDYTPPSWIPNVSSLNVIRSDRDGVRDPTGTYLHVDGKVRVYKTGFVTNNIPQTLTCGTLAISQSEFVLDETLTDGSEIYSFSKTSASQILDAGTSYTFTVEFRDTFITNFYHPTGISAPLTTSKTVGVAFITFSTNAKGKSAAFGAQAADTVSGVDNVNNLGPGRLDVYMNAYFNGDAVFNGNVSGIPSYTPVDEIVETGTDGDWTYRKWSSGIAECWGSHSWPITWDTWGNTNYGFRTSSVGYMTYPDGLFNAIPKEFVTGSISGGDGILAYNPNANITSARTNNYYFIRPVTGWDPAGPAHINVYAVGTWK